MKPDFLILVVDDDPTIIDMLRHTAQSCFSEASFIQVYNIIDAKAYINELDGHGPKLVLLDINLEDTVSGLDFLAFLRADNKTRILPVVMFTVSDLESDIRAAYSYGVSSFTTKPSSLNEWKTYLKNLRLYWLNTVTLPTIKFRK